MKNEVWKDIRGYEKYYQISNLGRIRRKERKVVYKDGRKYHYKTKLLGIRKIKNGYKTTDLTVDNKVKTVYIHRLLAENFIANHKGLPCINHINGNKTDNRLENLEWCSYGHNLQHAYDNNLRKKNKRILQFTLDDKFVKEWNSMNKAQKELKLFHIKDVCDGKRKKCGGYIWRYAEIEKVE
jgi:hypothetical protein